MKDAWSTGAPALDVQRGDELVAAAGVCAAQERLWQSRVNSGRHAVGLSQICQAAYWCDVSIE